MRIKKYKLEYFFKLIKINKKSIHVNASHVFLLQNTKKQCYPYKQSYTLTRKLYAKS